MIAPWPFGLAPQPPPPTSLDTRQQLGIGLRPERVTDPNEALLEAFRSAGERDLTKRDLADVLVEIARRADEAYDFDRFRWFDGKAGALRDCTKVRVVGHKGTGHGIARPLSCHVRGCPDCERSRVGRLLVRYDDLAAQAARPVFWTLTVRNAARGELAEGRKALQAASVKLRHRAIFRGGRCRWRWPDRGPTGELDGAPGHPCHAPVSTCPKDCLTRTGRNQSHCPTHPPQLVHPDGCPPSCVHAGHNRARNCPAFEHAKVTAGVAAFDVTYSEDRPAPWNIHLHMLVDAPWILWAEMRDHWQAITCDRAGCRHGHDPACTGSWMVWVEAVDRDDAERRHGAIREVLKYVGKPHGIVDSLDPGRVEEYLWALRHQRIVAGWGAWRGLQEDDEGELIDETTWRIGWGFSYVTVPRVCPVCHAHTTVDDWSFPHLAERLEATPLGAGLYGWRPPPPN